MSKTKQFATRMAVLAGAATLVVASAFADSRPSNETSWRNRDRGESRRDDDGNRGDYRRGDDSRNGGYGRDERRDDRRDDRYERRDGRSHGSRQPHYARGRVSRVERHGGGYRVWVGSERYPFFVPSRHYHRDRFRIGVVINLGGYYNPAGYYDYYDGGYDSRFGLRGTVERIDHRRDAFVLRDRATGRFVTVVSREPLRRMRRGDYVEVDGEWARNGVFRAYDVDLVGRY